MSYVCFSSGLLRAAIVIFSAACCASTVLAQDVPQPPAWQTSASGPMSFDVVSIHPSEPGTFLKPNIVLNNEDTPVPPGGLFIADFPLQIFIEFAYKIMPTHEQEEAMLAHLPRWVATDHFVIRAQFTGHPTKDQVRLMMRSLLADRFKLAVHFESKDLSVFSMVLDKPGKLGLRIRPHTQGQPCDVALSAPADPTSLAVPPGGFVPFCGRVQAINGSSHTIMIGARDLTLDHLAGYLPDFEDIGRPIVDETGLIGTFDFSLTWTRDPINSPSSAASESLDTQGPSFFEALKDQLGLKLVSARAPIQILVIDHVEQPSPN